MFKYINIKSYIFLYILLIALFKISLILGQCTPSVTTVKGKSVACVGQRIFEDEFLGTSINFTNWKRDVTLFGGGNHEFQWYSDYHNNSFVRNGYLYIKPSLTSAYYKLDSDTIDLGNLCTADKTSSACKRTGTPTDILSPICSAKLTTNSSFSFKYGHIVISAKMPAGDWLWSSLWMLPKHDEYGPWPRSGEIDLVEVRGNKNYNNTAGKNIGIATASSTLHWGPDQKSDGSNKTHYEQYKPNDEYDSGFKIYELIWKPGSIQFKINNEYVGPEITEIPNNYWTNSNNLMAPFDKEFFLILKVSVGGTSGFFPDSATNSPPKPWKNNAPHNMTDFWNNRSQWLPTWNLNNIDDTSLIVDYVHIYSV